MTRSRAFLVVALPIAVLMTAGDPVHAQAPQQPVTDQPMVSRSGIDLAALDKSANPCDDFYQFACGGWRTKHPIPSDRAAYGRFDELQDRNNEILKDILENAAKEGPGLELKKIGDYYSSCMDESGIETKGTAPLKADLARVDAIADKAGIPAVVGHLQTVGTTPFFGFGSAPDFKDATQYMLIIGQGGLGLPDKDYYLKNG